MHSCLTVFLQYNSKYRECPLASGERFRANESLISRMVVHNSFKIFPVVWNPWSDKAKGMSDFGDEEYKEMVCVEAGAVSSRVNLEPGLSMTFSQTITVSDP